MEILGIEARARRVVRCAQFAAGLCHQIFGNRGGLNDHFAVVLDHRRFAKRMNGFQTVRRFLGLGMTFVALYLVGKPKFLQQPYYALGATIFEVVDDDGHNGLPQSSKLVEVRANEAL